MLRRQLSSYSGGRDLVCLLNKRRPDLRLCLLAQLIVLDTKVDSALDRLVEDGHSIRRQDHDALEILQLPQEDRDEGVVLEMMLGASFEKDVRFVEEEDGLPAGNEVQDLGESVFKLLGVEAKISGTYLFIQSADSAFFVGLEGTDSKKGSFLIF